MVLIYFIHENKYFLRCSTLVTFIQMLRKDTGFFGLTDICKHSGKLQLFNMSGFQDIAKVFLHKISLKLKFGQKLAKVKT